MSKLRLLPQRTTQIDGLTLNASSQKYNFLVFGKRHCGRTNIFRKVAMDLLDKGEKVLYFGDLADVVNPGFFNHKRDLFFDHEMDGGVDWREGKGAFSPKAWVAARTGGGLFVFGDIVNGNDAAGEFLDAMLLALCGRAETGRHIHVFVENLHMLPKLKALLPALFLNDMHGFSVWLSAPSSFLIENIYGEAGLKEIADNCSGVIATLIDRDTAEFVRDMCGDEMAGLEELPPGKGAVYIRHRTSVEIQEVAVG